MAKRRRVDVPTDFVTILPRVFLVKTTVIFTFVALFSGATAVAPDRYIPISQNRTGARNISSILSPSPALPRATASSAPDDGDAETIQTSVADARQIRWAEAAMNYISSVECKQATFATARECVDVQRLDRSRLNVYMADPSPRGRLRTTLPDGVVHSSSAVVSSGGGTGTSRDAHDGVVVIDPYPEANFGHLVIVFHVTVGGTNEWCSQRDGKIIDDGECLTLAVKNRCRNVVERRNRRRNFDRRCEINFLPLVTADEDPTVSGQQHPRRHHNHHHEHHPVDAEQVRYRQMLTCRTNIPGFLDTCPSLLPRNFTSGLVWCNPLRENSKRCETTREALQRQRSAAAIASLPSALPSTNPDQPAFRPSPSSSTSTGCRIFEICDQAVIISGGWNRWTLRRHHADNVAKFYGMLRNHGFRAGNVKVFFANGSPDILTYDTASQSDIYPAAQKLVIRYHIQNLCSSPHCVDSLVIYLNGPATSDGTMLLWDLDQNGQASDSERYTLAELQSDLAGCQARHVHVIADQSYAGEMVRAFRRSRQHRHVAVYASGRDIDYSYGDEFTTTWIEQNHTRQCMKDVFREARRSALRSHPQMQHGDDGSGGDVTLFGAPCSVQPPFSYDELRQNYLGCQNLPTAIWVMKLKKASSSLSSSSSSSTAAVASVPPAGGVLSSGSTGTAASTRRSTRHRVRHTAADVDAGEDAGA